MEQQPCTFHSISLQIILQLIGLNFHRNARLGQLAEKVLLNIGAAKCRSEADGQFPTVRADTRLKLIGADKNIKAFDERLCGFRQVNFTDIGDGTGSIAFADGVGSPQNQVLDDQRLSLIHILPYL